MIFVVDTNVFSRSFKNVSLEVFNDIWEPWSKLMSKGQVISVDEVYLELESYWGNKALEMQWLRKHKPSFQKMTNEEGYIVSKIFQNKKFMDGVKERSILSGSPEADALLVAKAKVTKGVIVTAESDEKPNSEKIPNICGAFKVPYMYLNEYYKMLKNIYNDKQMMTNVKICFELGKPSLVGS